MELFDKTEQYNAEVSSVADELHAACTRVGLSFLLMVHVADTEEGFSIQCTSKRGDHPVHLVMGLCQRLLDSPEEAESIMRVLWIKDELFPERQSVPEDVPLN